MLNFEELFYYDESSPSCLRRKIAVYSGKHHSRLMASAGDAAGYLHRGYWNICIGRKTLQVHRIIMSLSGEIPDNLQVDHINGNKSDNRYVNLRLVTLQVNQQNQKMYKSNSSGFTGVCWKTGNKDGLLRAVARWQENGK